MSEEPEISPDLVKFCDSAMAQSLSLGHFVATLIKEIFFSERENRNSKGQKGKQALNPIKLATVKGLVFKYYEVRAPEQQNNMWKKSITKRIYSRRNVNEETKE